MFNPFAAFNTPLLHAFIKSGKRIFVKQSFDRGFIQGEEGIDACFIFTHYNDIGHAEFHYGAIHHDSQKSLYRWDNLEERQQLIKAAASPARIKMFSTVFVNDWETHVTEKLKNKVKRYVESDLGWKPARVDTVIFDIYVSYGELYVRIKLRGQEVRCRLAEIEKERNYVL